MTFPSKNDLLFKSALHLFISTRDGFISFSMLQILDFCILWTLHWRVSVTLSAPDRTRPSWPTLSSSSSPSPGTPPARPGQRRSYSLRQGYSVLGSRNYSVLIDAEVMLLEFVEYSPEDVCLFAKITVRWMNATTLWQQHPHLTSRSR